LPKQLSIDDPEIEFSIDGSVGVSSRRSRIVRLLDNAIDRDLYKHSLISAVAFTEDYLTTLLRAILTWYPQKLNLNIQGMTSDKQLDLNIILKAESLDALLATIIEKQLSSVFYASPDKYFQYIEQVLSINIEQEIKDTYIEVKATRDILIHNGGVVNALYLTKVGSRARASESKLIPIDASYVTKAIECMKRLTQEVYLKVIEKYGNDQRTTNAYEPPKVKV
jgi:hypothetical protein